MTFGQINFGTRETKSVIAGRLLDAMHAAEKASWKAFDRLEKAYETGHKEKVHKLRIASDKASNKFVAARSAYENFKV